ncbi:hypothetical protein KC867_00190 [Candidatus Saccharibacteria bacterium]|nr:hypothetical protein [Candidatus Saccharibacteria bacterium]
MPEENKAQNSDNQKSDKSPEELMSQVSNADESLDPSSKQSPVDSMADDSNKDIDPTTNVTQPKAKGIKGLLSKINIYLVLFILVVVIAAAAYVVMYFMNQKSETVKIETAQITEATLEELKTSDAVVGDPRQILTIESNAVITGKVVMRDTLDVAGALNVGGALSIDSINTAGPGTFQALQTNDLQAAGNVTIGGMLDVVSTISTGENLSVAGDINGGGRLDIGGQATIGGNLNVNGTISAKGINFDEISINRINITGNIPGVAVGSAAGGGGTASISGTDTAGTVTINTGGGTSPGILATINFTGAFSSNNPHPVITPNGPGCSSISYYVTNVSSTQFSIATSTPSPTGTSCKFNYIVIN